MTGPPFAPSKEESNGDTKSYKEMLFSVRCNEELKAERKGGGAGQEALVTLLTDSYL